MTVDDVNFKLPTKNDTAFETLHDFEILVVMAVAIFVNRVVANLY